MSLLSSLPRRIASLAASVLLTLLLAELGVRVVNPTPRVQIIRGHVQPDDWAHAQVPMFQSEDSEDLHQLACVTENPDFRVLAIAGDSILFGAHGDISHQLRRRASATGWCIVNGSEPGYYGDQQLAVAERFVERLNPEVLVWGHWKGDGRWVQINDDSWMETSVVPVNAGGLPSPWWMPPTAGRALMARSWL